MAKNRNYSPPSMVVRMQFLPEETGTSIPSYLHLSGPHANFVSSQDKTASSGFLGRYSKDNGLTTLLPLVLTGNVLDRDSVKISVKNAILQYFTPTTEHFLLPANARNVITADTATQSSGFSFLQNGSVPRSNVFFDRDVRSGDTVRVTATIDGVAEQLWTTVASVEGRLQPGQVDPTVVLDSHNAPTGSDSATILDFSEAAAAADATIAATGSWYDSMLARGVAQDTYHIAVVIGGQGTAARFSAESVMGDKVASITPVLNESQYEIAIGTTGAKLVLDDVLYTTPMSWTIQTVAKTTAVTATAGGSYNVRESQVSPRKTTYIVSVTKGGTIPATDPVTELEKSQCPTLSVQTNDGSDKAARLLIAKQGSATQISSSGATITFAGTYLLTGDKFYLDAYSPYTDTYPTLILNRNVPDEWVSDADADVSIELYISEAEIEIPEFSMTLSGRKENWSLDGHQISLNPGIELDVNSWTVDGQPSSLPLYGFEENKTSTVYMSMRYFVSDLTGVTTFIDSIETLDQVVSGPLVQENPLKYAAWYALRNGSQLYLTAVADPNDLEEWAKVTDLISERDDLFHIFPLAQGNRAVEQLFYEHVQAMNVPETAKERRLYLADYDQRLVSILTEKDGQPVTGKLGVETGIGRTSYTAYTVNGDDVDLLELGVKAGDILRTDYDFDRAGNEVYTEYTILRVINASTLYLTVDPSQITATDIPVVFEIWRNQTNADYAERISETGGFDDMLVSYIAIDNKDSSVSSLGPAAAYVGLIASVVPHQGVSWYPLQGFETEGWKNTFSVSQLNLMGGNGVTVIYKHQDGYLCARHSVTTQKSPEIGVTRTNTDLKKTEEMWIRNALLNVKEVRQALKGIVGVYNNVAGTHSAVRVNLESVKDRLKSDAAYPHLGGRVTDITDLKVVPNPLRSDRIDISLYITQPFPLNGIECRVFV